MTVIGQTARTTGWVMQSVLVWSALALFPGCHAARERGGAAETTPDGPKVVADAYSFNARTYREGKPTSFKLELYCTDSLVGMAARGYLGKGAFKGWLSRDTVRLYFAHSREELYESLDELVSSSDCGVPVAGLGFLQMFFHTPDSIDLPAGVSLASEYHTNRRASFRLESRESECPWRLELGYDRQEGRWVPQRLQFDNGRGLEFKAERERFRARIDISQKRFEVVVPPGTARIIP